MEKDKLIDPTTQSNTSEDGVEVPMSPAYLTKTACEVKAATMLINKEVTGMTMLELAKEIYAHACCFYGATVVKALGVDSAIVDEIYERANPVNIDNGGDTLERKIAYELIWDLTPSIISPV